MSLSSDEDRLYYILKVYRMQNETVDTQTKKKLPRGIL